MLSLKRVRDHDDCQRRRVEIVVTPGYSNWSVDRFIIEVCPPPLSVFPLNQISEGAIVTIFCSFILHMQQGYCFETSEDIKRGLVTRTQFD